MKCFITFIVLFFSISSQAEKKSFLINKEIFKTMPFITHTSSQPFGSYLAMNIHFSSVKAVFNQLDSFLKKNDQQTLNKKKARTEAHITVITPPEFDFILKKYVTIDEINEVAQKFMIQNSKFDIVCLGEGFFQNKNMKMKTYYLVVFSEDLLKVRKKIQQLFINRGGERKAFDPERFHPHITIGYTHKDLHLGPHKVKKNSETCKFDLILQPKG